MYYPYPCVYGSVQSECSPPQGIIHLTVQIASLTSLYTGLKFQISFFPHRIPGEECDTLLTHNSTVSKVTVNNDLIWETIVNLLIGLKFTFFVPDHHILYRVQYLLHVFHMLETAPKCYNSRQ